MAYRAYFAISSVGGDYQQILSQIKCIESELPNSFYIFMGNICKGLAPYKTYRLIQKLKVKNQAILLMGDQEYQFCKAYEEKNSHIMQDLFPDKKKLSDDEKTSIYDFFKKCPEFQVFSRNEESYVITTPSMPSTIGLSKYVCNNKNLIEENDKTGLGYDYMDDEYNTIAIDSDKFIRAFCLNNGASFHISKSGFEDFNYKKEKWDEHAKLVMMDRYNKNEPDIDVSIEDITEHEVKLLSNPKIKYGDSETYVFSPIKENVEELKRTIENISKQDDDPTYIFMGGILGYSKSLETLSYLDFLPKHDYILIFGNLEKQFIKEYEKTKSKKRLLQNIKKFIPNEDSSIDEFDLDLIYNILSTGKDAHAITFNMGLVPVEFVFCQDYMDNTDISVIINENQKCMDIISYTDDEIQMNTDNLSFIKLGDDGIWDYTDVYKTRREFLEKYFKDGIIDKDFAEIYSDEINNNEWSVEDIFIYEYYDNTHKLKHLF